MRVILATHKFDMRTMTTPILTVPSVPARSRPDSRARPVEERTSRPRQSRPRPHRNEEAKWRKRFPEPTRAPCFNHRTLPLTRSGIVVKILHKAIHIFYLKLSTQKVLQSFAVRVLGLIFSTPQTSPETSLEHLGGRAGQTPSRQQVRSPIAPLN